MQKVICICHFRFGGHQGHCSNDLQPISRQRLEVAHSNKIWWIAFTLGYLETPNMLHAPLPVCKVLHLKTLDPEVIVGGPFAYMSGSII